MYQSSGNPHGMSTSIQPVQVDLSSRRLNSERGTERILNNSGSSGNLAAKYERYSYHPKASDSIPPQIREHIAAQMRSSSEAMGEPEAHAISPRTNASVQSGGTSSPRSSKSSENSSKPKPRRNYVSTTSMTSGNSDDTLDIPSFEEVRHRAATQQHNPEVQLEFAKKLARAATTLASWYKDPVNPSTSQVDERIEQRNRDAWIAEAYKITRRLAVKYMYPNAIFFFGSSYNSGTLGHEIDYAKALELYLKAAKLDHPEASYRVAVCYEFGVGSRRDMEKAVSWYRKAAHLGSVSSMYKLGMLALQNRNSSEGLMWLQHAADKANPDTPHAVHELGLLYERGLEKLAKSDAKALEMFYKAARLNYSPAQARLGRAYEFGELGCDIDPSRSIRWYRAAAQQGDADAELGLCGWYWTGAESVNLRQSDTEAFLFAERAASKGHRRALFALGYFFEIGVGVPVDYHKARGWYMRAAEKHHPKALARLQEVEKRGRSFS